MRKVLLFAIVLMIQNLTFGQSIEKNWQFTGIENELGESILNINSEKDYLNISDGRHHPIQQSYHDQ